MKLRFPIVCLLAVAVAADAERHKFQTSDAAVAKQIIANGGRLVADYGGYQLYETDTPVSVPAENRDDYNRVLLHAGAIDTRAAPRQPHGAFAGKRMQLVQFAGPVQPSWREELEATGVRIVSYIPHNTYLVYGDAGASALLGELAGKAAHIQWSSAYLDAHKIHPRAAGADNFAIQLVADPDANAATLQLIERLKLAPIQRESKLLGYHNVVVRLPLGAIAQLAAQPDVVSIQPYLPRKKFCERQNQIIAGNLIGSAPAAPGYLDWLADKGFTQAQFDASGFAVDVSDSGIDDGTTSPNHFGLYTGGNTSAASRVIYNRLEGTAHTGSTLKGCDGHGTINSHIIAGYNNLSGFPHTDTNGYHYGLGVCPFVKVGSSVIFDPDTFTDPNYGNLISRAYSNGVRISNNSWGADTAGDYDIDAQQYDALVRDAQPAGAVYSASGNQPMILVFASGNAGPNAQTVGSPGTAKNVITVGAAEGVQAFGGSDGCSTPDTDANSANDIVDFSSRGPCSDGRKKPDIVAPGTHISGGVAQAANPGATGTADSCYDGSGVCGGTGGSYYWPNTGQQFFTASSGTSHSTPCVAGACALLRQYFLNHNLAPPGAAMTKAFLMNSARYLNGTYANDTLWSNNQGMGELNLGLAFDGAERFLYDEPALDMFTASGQTRTFTGTIADTNRSFRVTLAWTDAPGSTTGNAYNNNLDLTAAVGGKLYKGNVFGGANSTTGGVADVANNVESVFLPAGSSGAFTVTVTAVSINSDGVPNNNNALDQDFALVIYNGDCAPYLLVDHYTLVAESISPTNGVIDPQEVVTVSFALQNLSTTSTSNLVVTLLAANGVVSPSAPQTYGAIGTNDPIVARSFSFTANAGCGSNITAVLQLQDGPANLGTVSFNLFVGKLIPFVVFTQNFDGVTAPALPTGWTTSASGKQSNWTTVTTSNNTPPNAAYSPDPNRAGVNELVSPAISILSSSAELSFRNYYKTENGYDGGVLEIKVGTNAFTDILTAGGVFTSGGYNSTLSSFGTNPLRGRQAWSGNSGGFITTIARLPAAAAGQNIQLRWRCGSDGSTAGTGWYVDTIDVTDYYTSCAYSADLDITKTGMPNPVAIGSNLTYTITVANLGPSSASSVTVTDALPSNVNFVSVTPSQGTATNVAGVISCALGSLANNATATVQLVVAPTAAGSLTNTATVSGAQTDPVTSNNTATAVTTATPVADLMLTKTNAPNTVVAGQTLTYSLTVSNLGPSAASSIVVTDTLPSAVTFQSATAPLGTWTNIGNLVIYSLDTLVTGTAATATIVATAANPTPYSVTGMVQNTAVVFATEFDPNTTNNTAVAIAAILADSDHDGIPDAWMLTYFGQPTGDANADPDGDGMTNFQEYLAGTSPIDSANVLRIIRIATAGNDLAVTFLSVTNKLYAVERNADLTNLAGWSAIQTNIPGTGMPVTITDPAATIQPCYFYRVRLQSSP